MREQMEDRLHTLKAEFKAGQEMLAELEAKQVHLEAPCCASAAPCRCWKSC